MESSPSSKISFFTTGGRFIPNPIEGLECGISVAIPRESEGNASLKLGATELPLWFADGMLCALSAWPACGPGQYKIFLKCGDINERRIITVRPQHFNESECNRIIQELTELLPMSIAIELQKCGGLNGIRLVAPGQLSLEQECQRLRAAIKGTKEQMGILQLLPIIQKDCHQVLIPKHEMRRGNKTRRPDMAMLPLAMSMPGNVGSDGYLYQMFDLTVERSYETYENRLVKAYVQALQSQLLKLLSRLEAENAPPAVIREMQDLFDEFRLKCVRTEFLNKLRLPFIAVGHITMVLLKKPAYRTVLEQYLALFNRTPVRLKEPALNTALNKFPYLYQLWANFKVVNVMLKVCAEAGYRCIDHKWVRRDNDGFYFDVMKDCSIAIELFSAKTEKTVKLVPWSPASGQVANNHRQDMPPAIAVCIYSAAAPPVVLIFDPKYKVIGESPEETATKLAAAPGKMLGAGGSIEPIPEHIDELRACIEAVKSPEGQREIQYAAILYPGSRKQILSELEALTARPDDGEALEKIIGDVLRRYLN